MRWVLISSPSYQAIGQEGMDSSCLGEASIRCCEKFLHRRDGQALELAAQGMFELPALKVFKRFSDVWGYSLV